MWFTSDRDLFGVPGQDLKEGSLPSPPLVEILPCKKLPGCNFLSYIYLTFLSQMTQLLTIARC